MTNTKNFVNRLEEVSETPSVTSYLQVAGVECVDFVEDKRAVWMHGFSKEKGIQFGEAMD